MGLNITAYARLEKIHLKDVEFAFNGIPVNERVVSLFYNPDYPYHLSGLENSDFFVSKGEKFNFRAGSYNSYNEWRDWLAQVAGFKSSNEVWSRTPIGPFVELINFSNEEGTIGPFFASKLAKDFKDFEKRAKELGQDKPFFLEQYYNWKRACEVATKKGAICFG